MIERRRRFLKELNLIISEIHRDLSGQLEELKLEYAPDVLEEEFDKELILSEERDLHQGTTSRGPHRDDVVLKINDIDIRHFGSQGQQRTAALSLKLAEIELVKSKIMEPPVLLLDDVLSELDHHRQDFLLKRIGSIQTILTCTGLDEFVRNNVRIDRLFRIDHGQIKMEK